MQLHHFPARQSIDWHNARVNCEDDGAATRTIAPRVLGYSLAIPRDIAAAARKAQQEVFKDFSKGHSTLCENDVCDASLLRYLGRDSQLDFLVVWLHEQGLVQPDYALDANWLTAHEVGFHTDPTHAFQGAFLVWQVAGPAKAVDFPQVGQSYFMQVGDALLFDGASPHGLRLPEMAGQVFEDAGAVFHPPQGPDDITVYVSVELPWFADLERILGVERDQEEAGEYDVDARTGAMKVMVPV